ncbi:NUDIX domain-containing protein [bacterium]|nr:NUDIX domain-containing protein [bacterium]
MPKRSAGLLMYRRREGIVEVFLVHPGGPFWTRKDLGCWSIPKGEYLPGEDPLPAARREFEEETGFTAQGEFRELTEIRQKGGKLVKAWALEGDCDPAAIKSNTFILEWPPRSGKQQEFPEIDRAGWFAIETARQKILESQVALLEELCEML